MSTVRLTASADYGQTGQYVARIRGRDDKFTFDRTFIGRKEGKRGETTVATTDEPGLYEVRNSTRKGKRTSFVLVIRNESGDLADYYCHEDNAMRIAREIGEGKAFDQIVHATPDGWDWGPRQSADARAVALDEIRRLMGEHGITPDEIARIGPE